MRETILVPEAEGRAVAGGFFQNAPNAGGGRDRVADPRRFVVVHGLAGKHEPVAVGGGLGEREGILGGGGFALIAPGEAARDEVEREPGVGFHGFVRTIIVDEAEDQRRGAGGGRDTEGGGQGDTPVRRLIVTVLQHTRPLARPAGVDPGEVEGGLGGAASKGDEGCEQGRRQNTDETHNPTTPSDSVRMLVPKLVFSKPWHFANDWRTDHKS